MSSYFVKLFDARDMHGIALKRNDIQAISMISMGKRNSLNSTGFQRCFACSVGMLNSFET